MAGVIDWGAAAAVAAHAVPPGPTSSVQERTDLVAGLRAAAVAAIEPIVATSQMRPAGQSAESGEVDLGRVLVVDRVGWTRANAQTMRAMTAPLDRLERKTNAATQLAAGAEAGAVLALLAPRVLGQFDPYGRGPGRLLLVAPNVLSTERAMQVDPSDFRLWVTLHEQTHALQFATAPFLAEVLLDRITGMLNSLVARSIDLSEASGLDRLRELGRTLHAIIAGLARPDGPPLIERLLHPSEREALADITAIMSLLEGHADVMMDAVGPQVVPSVATIRERFERRRDGEGSPRADVILRRLMGMDVKVAQYRDGADFVRAVEAQVGRGGFNAVWAAPENLPRASEIEDPSSWVRRVHG